MKQDQDLTADEPLESAPASAADAARTPAEAAPPSFPAEDLPLMVEAALMSTDRSLPAAKLAELLGQEGVRPINEAIARLNEVYEQSGRSFRIEQIAGGYQILTLPRFGQVLAAISRTRAQTRLTPTALETLAVIAYKQPVMRAEVEAIRGVACGDMIRTLTDLRLVRVVGRAQELGRPLLYGTTRTFLEVFGLANLKDLPKVEELLGGKRKAADAPASQKAEA